MVPCSCGSPVDLPVHGPSGRSGQIFLAKGAGVGVCRGARGMGLAQQQVQVLSCLLGGMLNGLLYAFLQASMTVNAPQWFGCLMCTTCVFYFGLSAGEGPMLSM